MVLLDVTVVALDVFVAIRHVPFQLAFEVFVDRALYIPFNDTLIILDEITLRCIVIFGHDIHTPIITTLELKTMPVVKN
jgi:hypothetical protein